MKAKCPRCDYKGESIDGKCQVCGLPLDVKPSLLMKFRSMNSKIRGVIIILLIIFTIWIFLLIVPSREAIRNYKSTETKEAELTRYSNPIEGFLGVIWGDSMAVAEQKLLSNGYKIKEVDNIGMEIKLKSFILADYPVEKVNLKFYSKGFYTASVIFDTSLAPPPPPYPSDKISTVINQKYGQPTYSTEKYIIYATLSGHSQEEVPLIIEWESMEKCKITLSQQDRFIVLIYENEMMKNKDAAELAAQEKTIELLREEHRQTIQEKKNKEEMEHYKDLSKPF